MKAQDYWIADHGELVTFARVLDRAGAFDRLTENVIYYFEKPHKWSPEHERWIAMGRPDAPDLDALMGERTSLSEGEVRDG